MRHPLHDHTPRTRKRVETSAGTRKIGPAKLSEVGMHGETIACAALPVRRAPDVDVFPFVGQAASHHARVVGDAANLGRIFRCEQVNGGHQEE